jgi:ParB-like chromosome segregation protein Spo0J
MVNDTSAKWVDPEDLIPWEENPRNNDHAVDNLKRSIEMYGFTSPIIVRKATNQVIAGHTRLKAALSLGLKTVPVRFLEISESKARELAIADNKIGEIATWNDDELVTQILAMEEERGDIDFSDLGFSEDEIAGLLCGQEFGDEEVEADAETEQSELTKISFTVPSEFGESSVGIVKGHLEDAFPDLSIRISATEMKLKTLH